MSASDVPSIARGVAAKRRGRALYAEDARAGGCGELDRGLTDFAVGPEDQNDVAAPHGSGLAQPFIRRDEGYADSAGLGLGDGGGVAAGSQQGARDGGRGFRRA